MSVVIDGTTGISGNNGSASTPAFQGEDSNTGVFFPAADTIAFAEGGVEVARFDSNGRLGVGTTSPSAQITIGRLDTGSEGGQIDLCRASDNASAWAIDAYGSTSTPSLRFVDNVASATRMSIDSSGTVTATAFAGAVTPGYTSSEVTLSRDYSATFAHGLGARPSQIQMNLRCVSAQLGYAVNDVVYFSGGPYDINSGQGINIAADATNIYFGVYYVYVRTRTGGGGSWPEITYANWRASMVAWR